MGGVRPILDLKDLNAFMRVHNFVLESIFSVVVSFHQGDFLVSINIKETTCTFPSARDVSVSYALLSGTGIANL